MSKKFTSKHVSVEWKFDLSKVLRDNFSNRQWSDLSESVVNNLILRKIDKGLSPVNGVRAFQKYKDPKKYPGDQKPSNKPNLTLSGSMLSHYEARPGKEPMSLKIGIHADAPAKELVKARANNEGTQGKALNHIPKTALSRKAQGQAKAVTSGIPARPFVPKKDQTYTRDIILEIRKLFAYCLKQAINRGKNK